MTAVHYIDIAAPIDARVEVYLEDSGRVAGIVTHPFGATSIEQHMAVQRAAMFATYLIGKAESQGKLSEDVVRHLKALGGFDLEYAVAKAVMELQATVIAAATSKLFTTKRGAA